MPRKKTQKATPAVIERLERTAQAIELRKSGATFARIGDHFGVSAQSAHEMVMKGLKATLAEPAAEHRALAVQRLDHMLNAIWTAATNGDLQAQAGVLRLEERRAKLLGLDAPNKQIEDVRGVSDAKASLLAKWNLMAERMRPPEIAAPLKDVTPLIEPEPSADAKTESVTKSVTKPVASVTKSPTAMTPVTKKRGRPAANGKAMTPAEKQRAFRERRKAKD
jgi:hypothetical protein